MATLSDEEVNRLLIALRPLRLIVTGGGTSGGACSAPAVARAAERRLGDLGIGLEVLWIGSDGGPEELIASEEGIAFHAVACGAFRRERTTVERTPANPAKTLLGLPRAVAQARSAVARFRPDVVLSAGGDAAVPVGVAARLCGRPLVVHEETGRPGPAERVLAGVATRVSVPEPATPEDEATGGGPGTVRSPLLRNADACPSTSRHPREPDRQRAAQDLADLLLRTMRPDPGRLPLELF
ncbi:glycosyltransferase [Streptomyces sp. NPDC004667]|uniref:glycosyltransferase n=1 Tax=Streptomyces sp. NPDC004667 TaxID=3154285 RepID=UPI0033BAF6E9